MSKLLPILIGLAILVGVIAAGLADYAIEGRPPPSDLCGPTAACAAAR